VCGIFGAISFAAPFSDKDLDNFIGATDVVAYRGPDNRDFFVSNDKKLYFGHRRLSIIDLLPEGNQPLTMDGLCIIYNGEIFNYLELRKELEDSGYVFRTNTDTEVILRTYQKYGPSGFEKFNGMWAFAIFDSVSKKLILSRDRFSVKPLYYLKTNDRMFFSSEIKQLLAFLEEKEVNERQMFIFLQQGITDYDEDTFIKGIKRIKAKHNLIVDLNNGTIKYEKYWDYQFIEIPDFDSAIDYFRNLFFDSVRLRLRSDVKVGALLSGGLDSSSIVAASNTFSPIESYSVVTKEKEYSEEKYINILTQKLGVPNRKLYFLPSQVFENLPIVLYHQDEPFAGMSIVAQYMIFNKIKQETDVKVVLSGQGGDEVLMGYLKYYFMYLQGLIKKGELLRLGTEIVSSFVNRTALWQFDLRVGKRYLGSLSKLSFVSPQDFGLEPIWQAKSLRDRQILDIDKYSVPILTRYEDRNSMANSIEVRNPFLDHRLVNFCLSLPDSYKIGKGWSKFILRQSMHELPQEIRWRRDKKGFVTPESLWLKNELKHVVYKNFQDSILAQQGFINKKRFFEAYESFLNDKGTVSASDISRALIAELWLRNLYGFETYI